MRVEAALAVLCVSVLVGCPLAVAMPAGSGAGPADVGDARAQVDAPTSTTRIVIHVNPSGNARWNVSAEFALETESQVAAFDRLADEFERGEAEVGFDAETFRKLAEQASGRTGRSMNITDVERLSTVRNTTDGGAVGVLSLQFTWTSFAETENGRMHVGDAFGSDWQLRADQRLTIHPPANHGVIDFSPPTQLDSGTLQWQGPQAFAADEPRVTYVRGVTPGRTTPENRTTTPSPPTMATSDLLFGVGFAVLLFGGLLAYAMVHRGWRPFGDSGPAAGAETRSEADTDAATAPEADVGDDGAAAAAGSNPDGDAAAAADADTADEGVDPELLSDEERVERLLRDNGGRMKQATIVTETDWSNAKVSQLLSAMDEEGRIDKLRIGRENLISLADEGENETESRNRQ